MSDVPPPKGQPRRIKRTSWKEYLLRFGFGGLITAMVGVVATVFGAVVAGLFLAFPAILPASLTLIAAHEDKKAAGHAANGAIAGSIGLAAFGALIWALTPTVIGVGALLCALAGWLVAGLLSWMALEKCWPSQMDG